MFIKYIIDNVTVVITVFALIDAQCASAEERCTSIELRFSLLFIIYGHTGLITSKTLIGIQLMSKYQLIQYGKCQSLRGIELSTLIALEK